MAYASGTLPATRSKDTSKTEAGAASPAEASPARRRMSLARRFRGKVKATTRMQTRQVSVKVLFDDGEEEW